jgi:hypothetical protein
MSKTKVQQLLSSQTLFVLLIFLITWTIFSLSKVHQLTDSSYSMVASQSVLEYGTFSLNHYAFPREQPRNRGYYISDGLVYQLELTNGNLLYHLPPGSSILSIPYVGVMRLFGISSTKPDGTYDVDGEARIQYSLAALLMSLTAVIFFMMARTAGLSLGWSTLIAFGASLGTQVWSTTSRGMWSDTWGIVLLALALWMLMARELAGRKLNPFLFATLLSWLFFVRPTYAVHIAAVTVYVLLFHRDIFLKYALTGAAWLIAFIAFSRHYHGRVLPSYYQASRLNFDIFWTAFAGNLLSPGRGFLVYVPIFLFVIYLLVRYWKQISHPRLVVLSFIAIAGHLVAISGFGHWWGGHSFGARFSAGLVPWVVLLAILAIKAMLQAHEANKAVAGRVAWKAQLTAGAVLLLFSVFVNSRGAMSHPTWLWNVRPRDVDRFPERVWDWREPQFLAGLVPTPLPEAYAVPVGNRRIDFASEESDKLVWYGWSNREQQLRWTEGTEAGIVFKLDHPSTITLRTKLGPFLALGKHDEQRVLVGLNGQLVTTLRLRENRPDEYDFVLPASWLREKNVLTFRLPDAISPASLNIDNPDPRQLGIAVFWMKFQSQVEQSSR